MKTKLLKQISVTIIVSMILILSNVGIANAALQANGNSRKTDTIGNWLLKIRQMEATGGTLGLADTINTTDLTSSATNSNNLDIHMEKNTEYGAMAILSASPYGNQNKINDGETTTGNKSGVYINLNMEWVSAGSLTNISQYTNANTKYKNEYTSTYVAKVGDAISETASWHGSIGSTWLSGYYANTYAGLIRAYSGSIFSYYGNTGASNGSGAAYAGGSRATRAVIVVGDGF